jgi:hypothetical protein
MKRCILAIAVAIVLLGSLLFSYAGAGGSEAVSGSRASTPGVAAAEAISTITGVAISPLLGVSAVGVWKYFKTPPEQREDLPWFAQPWFWVPGLLIVTLCFVKDTAGTALPTAAKKPLDVLDAFENKVSALIAAGAFVPLIAAFMQSVNEAGAPDLPGVGPFLAAINLTSVINVLMVPISIAAFLVVWMAAHAINILILLSPFTTLDLALKACRTLLLSVIAGTAMLDPVLGAMLSMLVIFLSFFVAGWSFRMMVLGTVFAWDFLTRRQRRFEPNEKANRAFLATSLQRTPIRSLGWLTKSEQGQLQFEYRPWLVLARRKIALPTGSYAAGCGLLHPVLLKLDRGQQKEILWFPPRFTSHEEALARIYNLQGVHDVGLLKGFKAVWQWLKGLCGLGRVPSAPAVQSA